MPTSYLTSTKNLADILTAIQTAQTPPKFNRTFLDGLGFKSSTDRLVINVLKAIGFLNADGTPTERYIRYLDQTQAGKVLAEGIREGYADLFQLNRKAHEMGTTELKGKIRTLTQGKASDDVVKKMATTFGALAAQADFEGTAAKDEESDGSPDEQRDDRADEGGDGVPPLDPGGELQLGGLVYNVQVQLPESRDPAVYDALFRSLRAHLLR